jgi:hypothetical protein
LRQAFYFRGKYVKDSGDITALSLSFESRDFQRRGRRGSQRKERIRKERMSFKIAFSFLSPSAALCIEIALSHTQV